MSNITWLMIQNFLIFPVLGMLCGTTLSYAKFYKSKFHYAVGIHGLIVTILLFLKLNDII